MKSEEQKQKAREYSRKYREEHPEYKAKWAKISGKSSVEKRKQKYQNDPIYRKEQDKKAVERAKRRREKERKQVIEAYGGKCEICGIVELRFLTLDHSFGDGGVHRKSLGDGKNSSCHKVYRDIIKRGFPKDEGYRVLCWNHNCGGAY